MAVVIVADWVSGGDSVGSWVVSRVTYSVEVLRNGSDYESLCVPYGHSK